ncbi:unnamed protein product [Taenia asiatica]|uniref:Uncharacterized protein n=1 Tax=Taenia asiatica TaxID=60517 RepID=A0A3P6P6I1_TAEAS|nr:unnamed protein product [Taenia asiatica]
MLNIAIVVASAVAVVVVVVVAVVVEALTSHWHTQWWCVSGLFRGEEGMSV